MEEDSDDFATIDFYGTSLTVYLFQTQYLLKATGQQRRTQPHAPVSKNQDETFLLKE